MPELTATKRHLQHCSSGVTDYGKEKEIEEESPLKPILQVASEKQ